MKFIRIERFVKGLGDWNKVEEYINVEQIKSVQKGISEHYITINFIDGGCITADILCWEDILAVLNEGGNNESKNGRHLGREENFPTNETHLPEVHTTNPNASRHHVTPDEGELVPAWVRLFDEAVDARIKWLVTKMEENYENSTPTEAPHKCE